MRGGQTGGLHVLAFKLWKTRTTADEVLCLGSHQPYFREVDAITTKLWWYFVFFRRLAVQVLYVE